MLPSTKVCFPLLGQSWNASEDRHIKLRAESPAALEVHVCDISESKARVLRQKVSSSDTREGPAPFFIILGTSFKARLKQITGYISELRAVHMIH